MEPNQYKVGTNFKAISIAIANATSNAIKTIKNTCTIIKKSMSEKKWNKIKVVFNEIASLQRSNNKLDNTVHSLSEALTSIDEIVIRGSVIKTYDLIEKIMFYMVLIKATILRSCALTQITFLIILIPTKWDLLNVTLVALDTMLIDFGPMRHVFCVSLLHPCDMCFVFLFKTESLNKCACAISICEERKATAIVSQTIHIKKVGRKIVARSRKIQIGTPAKVVPVSSKKKVFLLIPVKA